MRRVLATAVGGVVLLVPITFVSGCAPATSCGSVGFIPNSDSGVFEITAYGVGCSTARAVATMARPGPPSYSAYGFSCKGTHYYNGLAHTGYVCSGPRGQGVTFDLSY